MSVYRCVCVCVGALLAISVTVINLFLAVHRLRFPNFLRALRGVKHFAEFRQNVDKSTGNNSQTATRMEMPIVPTDPFRLRWRDR